MRHEVGHAVHEMHTDLVNNWLENRFGWRVFGTNNDDIDAWVNLMGGWGDLSMTEQNQVYQFLRIAIGKGASWVAGPAPAPPARHPWYQPDFGPRLAFEKTGSNWFVNYEHWFQKDGRAYFLNFWYSTLMVVDVETLRLVNKMPSNYASMSHFEFFAELYALY